MASILIALELGAGLGHRSRSELLAASLRSAGHQSIVHFARSSPAPPHGGPPDSLSGTLARQGFDDSKSLRRRVDAWIDAIRDGGAKAVVADHAPGALLTAMCLGMTRFNCGTGFTCPPESTPCGPYASRMPDGVIETELRVLDAMNQVLDRYGRAPLTSVSGLFNQGVRPILATFAELDHYGRPATADFIGPWQRQGGEQILFPPGNGPRVFVYAKTMRALRPLLEELRKRQWPTVAYFGGAPDPTPGSDTLHVSTEPVDLASVLRDTDVAILNGTHASTAAALLAGVPILQFPLYPEQLLLSQRVRELGAGLIGRHYEETRWQGSLELIANRPKYAEQAAAFAQRHADHNDKRSLDRAVLIIDQALQAARPA